MLYVSLCLSVCLSVCILSFFITMDLGPDSQTILRHVLRQFQTYDNLTTIWQIHKAFKTILRHILRQILRQILRHACESAPGVQRGLCKYTA